MSAHFKLIIITAENTVANEAATINRLFKSGLQTLHLRKPGWSQQQTAAFLKEIAPGFHTQIVLHTHFALTENFNLKGIHLNEENKNHLDELRQFKIVSASFHSLKDLKENTFPYAYVFLSPVFNSISKSGYPGAFQLDLLLKDLQAIKNEKPALPPIFALGGISASNLPLLKYTPFAGAVLLGSIWQNENPVKAFEEIKTVAGN